MWLNFFFDFIRYLFNDCDEFHVDKRNHGRDRDERTGENERTHVE